MSEPSGVLLVDKPSGPTSFDVVRRVRSIMKTRRAGHTGTLDPLATGLLPVCVGDATRIASYVTEGEKEYQGLVRFGVTTDTQDAAGKVLESKDASGLTRAAVEAVLAAMPGVVHQVTPMFSARKVGGRRLYELARAGEEVEREARAVTIDEARLLEWNPPDALILVRCSKGTYIRTIAQDLGEALGVGAHLAGLRRTASGRLHVANAHPLDKLMELSKSQGPQAVAELLVSVEEALADLPALKLDLRTATSLAFGKVPDRADLARLRAPAFARGRRVRLLGPDDFVVAIAESTGEGELKLLRVLRAQTGPGTHRAASAPDPDAE